MQMKKLNVHSVSFTIIDFFFFLVVVINGNSLEKYERLSRIKF